MSLFHQPSNNTLAHRPVDWLCPELGEGVGALMSTREGGVSRPPFAASNLGLHVGDDPAAVADNRRHFAAVMGAEPIWLQQVHGNRVLRLHSGLLNAPMPTADGALCTEPGLACTVMVADCLPILLVAPLGRGVAALHAGWRGLSGAGALLGQGIAETGVAALCEATSCDPQDLRAWLGACIGPAAFEVGADVLMSFGVAPSQAHPRFQRLPIHAGLAAQGAPKWLANLAGLARDRLCALGLQADAVSGGQWCTFSEASRFFSYRREPTTGRQAASIWLRHR